MTSIFDQYEQASQVSQVPRAEDALTSSGYVNMQLEDNAPMFSKQKMNFTPSDLITHVAVANDHLALAMANGKLFRMDLKNPDQSEEINFSRNIQSTSKLTKIYLDPLGNHLLMAFASRTKEGYPELLYLHRKSTKLKSVSKSRNYELTEVGWNYENKSEAGTGPILLGTSQGHILEFELEADSDKMFTGSQSWRQLPNYLPLYGGKDIDGLVFDIGKGTDTPITGIEFHRVLKTTKYFIFVTTPTRLYQFIGHAQFNDEKPSLQSIFQTYLTMPETGFQEIPSSLKYSKLQFYLDKANNPKTFAWLTEPGIFFGQLDPTSQQNSNTLFTQGELVAYPAAADADQSKEKTPLSFALTEFHALLMFSDRIKAISLLNQELVYESFYSEAHGKLKDIVKDPTKKTIWAVTDKTVFRYKVIREDRNVWRIFTDKGQFELAKEYCQNNPACVDVVNVKQAEILFEKGEFLKSAEIYAETLCSFETVCLKFLDADENDALKVYLTKRLEALEDEDKTLTPMIVIWMTELYLAQLSSLRHSGEGDSRKYHETQSDFEVFLLQPKVSKCMQHLKPVIYELMSSHGDKANLKMFTVLNEDFEKVVALNVDTQSYKEALETLQRAKRPELFYQFAPVLIQEAPKETVDALIAQSSALDPKKLLPAFLSCEHGSDHVTEIVRYLEYRDAQFGMADTALQNYLITLYARHRPDALMRYLSRQGRELEHVHYDVYFVLRLCQAASLAAPTVHLLALLGLWEEAVRRALDADAAAARALANQPDDDDTRKKLWLIIAQHELSQQEDVQVALRFLRETPLLKIEDLLPLFSDIATIDHFREPICQSLQEYNNEIEDLKAEMEEATKAAEFVRNELQSLRGVSAAVSGADRCSLCGMTLLLRPLYLFPCLHRFHADCLLAELAPYRNEATNAKIAELQRQLSSLPAGEPARALADELDDLVAAECVYCGEHMLQSIDKPLIEDDDWERVMKEWE